VTDHAVFPSSVTERGADGRRFLQPAAVLLRMPKRRAAMATITGTSTEAEIATAYLANCGYEEDDDATKAAAFVTVLRAMLKRGLTQIRHDNEEMRFSIEQLREEIKDARRFISQSAGAAASVVHPSLEYYRD
jgi:hypothetical protein